MHDVGQTSLETILLLKERDLLQQLYYQQWVKSKVDLLISPTMPFTAPYHGQTENAIHQLTFTAFQNVLELPAGHVPVRLVQAN
jgi:Asp-tRNA(Asn)/Glu-tRNA(Gln) amidotransferase A subunit family amidase